MTITEVKVGDRLTPKESPSAATDFYGVWYVHEVQARGLVVTLRNGSHKHLMEWWRVEQMQKL
jgi:hypothetical protein